MLKRFLNIYAIAVFSTFCTAVFCCDVFAGRASHDNANAADSLCAYQGLNRNAFSVHGEDGLRADLFSVSLGGIVSNDASMEYMIEPVYFDEFNCASDIKKLKNGD
ncbi:MAG: hypothetical protein FWC57_02680 [Endomicrobia bacterium]|nr:hypothetical protein [Endomicrobiia bacterium]